MKDPVLRRVHRGPKSNHAIIIVPGMWTMESGCDQRWIAAIAAAGFDGTIYDFVWDSSSATVDLTRVLLAGNSLGGFGGALASPESMLMFAAGPIGLGVSMLAGAALGNSLFRAPSISGVGGSLMTALSLWKRLKKNAKRAGAAHLPGVIESQIREKRVTLVGHSLGARVCYYAVDAGARVNRLITMGGAIPGDGTKDWARIARRLPGGLRNVRNEEDAVLKQLYRLAELDRDPIGLKPIPHQHRRITEYNMTRIMRLEGSTGFQTSHSDYFRSFAHHKLLG